MAHSFPIARKLWALAQTARLNWLARHQNSFNFWIHLIGIPLACIGIVLLFVAPWYWGLTALVLGYVLQAIGHFVEGNDVGELIPLKRLLCLPVVAIAPQFVQSPKANEPNNTARLDPEPPPSQA